MRSYGNEEDLNIYHGGGEFVSRPIYFIVSLKGLDQKAKSDEVSVAGGSSRTRKF